MTDEPEYLTTAALAARLKVSTESIRKWRKAGKITPAFDTPGGAPRWKWPLEDGDARPEE